MKLQKYLCAALLLTFPLFAHDGIDAPMEENPSMSSSEEALNPENFWLDPLLLSRLDYASLPKHIALIADGNRRWAKDHGVSLEVAYEKSGNVIVETARLANSLGIETLTIYCFSTENWKRTSSEISKLFAVIEFFFAENKDKLIQYNIKVDTIGDLSRLPLSTQRVIQETKFLTQDSDGIEIVLAFNYGARDEMCRAIKHILDDHDNHLLNREDINETLVSQYLDTHKWPDPDLLIRTSEARLSNFLLWQLSYTEIYFSPVFWPDFGPKEFYDALLNFQNKQRRTGK